MTDNKAVEELPLYLQAKKSNFKAEPLNKLLKNNVNAELIDISDILYKESKSKTNLTLSRAFAALGGVASFYFTPKNINEPFSAMTIMGDKRSAIPSDFIGEILVGLESIALDIENITLRARVCDLVWLLNRANYECGKMALNSYHGLVIGSRDKTLELNASKDGELGYRSEEYLRRAFCICRGLNNPEELLDPIRITFEELILKAVKEKNVFSVQRFSRLGLDFNIVTPDKIAEYLETTIKNEEHFENKAKLWELAAEAHHRDKDDKNKWRCKINSAECYFRYSENQSMAMLKSHWMSVALATYQGIPDQKVRRTELRHKLIDVQAHINEEMSLYSHPMDLGDLVQNTEETFDGASPFKKLIILASCHKSPSLQRIKEDAITQIQKNPLSSLFAKTQHDSEGKVIHKTKIKSLFGEIDNSTITDKIVQNQSLLRNIIVKSAINPALQIISNANYPRDVDIETICTNSPFIPSDRQEAYFMGIRSFLFGDNLTAISILIPQLENSVRHVLKMNDFDPTSFDKATHIQEDRSLTSIYIDMRQNMEHCFGPEITYELENLFLTKSGANLRNRASHGLVSDYEMYSSDAVYACWFIYRLCCIPIFPQWRELELI